MCAWQIRHWQLDIMGHDCVECNYDIQSAFECVVWYLAPLATIFYEVQLIVLSMVLILAVNMSFSSCYFTELYNNIVFLGAADCAVGYYPLYNILNCISSLSVAELFFATVTAD